MSNVQTVEAAIRTALCRGETVGFARTLPRFLLAKREGERVLVHFVARGYLRSTDDEERIGDEALARLLPSEVRQALECWPRPDKPCKSSMSPLVTTPTLLNAGVVRALLGYGLVTAQPGGEYLLTERGRKCRGLIRMAL